MKVRGENIKKDFVRKTKDTNIFTAVKTCDIEIPAGALTVVRGRSGGGKSTLLNILAGILKPTEGKVFYDDMDIYEMDDEALSQFRNENIGYVPQGKSAIASLSVFENIMLPGILYGNRNEEKAAKLMEQFDITGIKNAMPEELSGGELRRMAIARALINNPKVLFADEPTGDLDDENTIIVFEALKNIAKEGTAVLMITHEGEAEGYADRVFRMDAGVLSE